MTNELSKFVILRVITTKTLSLINIRKQEGLQQVRRRSEVKRLLSDLYIKWSGWLYFPYQSWYLNLLAKVSFLTYIFNWISMIDQYHFTDPFQSLFDGLLNQTNALIQRRSIQSDGTSNTKGILNLPLPLQYIRPCTPDNGLQPCFSSGSYYRDGFQIDYYAGISTVMKTSDAVNSKSKNEEYLNLPIPIQYVPKCNLKNGLKPCIFVGEWDKDDLVVCYYMGIAKVSKCDKPPPSTLQGSGTNLRKSSLEGAILNMIKKAPISS